MSRSDSTTYLWGRLDVPSQPHYVPAVRRAVERLGAEADLSRRDIEDLDLAVTEACANAIRHGSPKGAHNRIHIAFYLEPERVIVEIRDEGAGFDPNAEALPTPGDLCDGGYGLHIMRQVVDRVEIQFGDGTTVRLHKARRGKEAPRLRAPRSVRRSIPGRVPALAA
ncbi:MAG: ATP-binding protein [Armatimonadetes bacterium]|nr:ATP-binding protein [Armatimonadota bacterium]